MGKKNKVIEIPSILITLVLLLFLAIILKLGYVNVAKEVDGIDIEEFALNRNTAKVTLYAPRGSIYDVNGETLASDVNSYTVIAVLDSSRTTDPANPQHVVDKERTAKELSPLINMSEEAILNLLNYKAWQVELGPGGRGITELTKSKIEALDLPGIIFSSSTKRYYQKDNFASYLIGYAKKNDEGKITGELGVEAYYNDDLTGIDGYTEYQQDIYGYQIPTIPAVTIEPESGKDIYLTIDNNIQLFLESAVKKLDNDYTMDWITFSVMDAKTGAILGSASSPSFNPNKLDITSYLNPLVSYQYEPGSTMKMYSFMAAMENGIYDGNSTYESGVYKVDDAEIRDWNNVGWGTITYDQGFAYSSNTAASRLAIALGKDKLASFYKQMGFGKKTGVNLPGEVAGDIDFNYRTEIATASFGQGITTTPIQNLQGLTAIANDGVMLKPYIIDKIVNPNTKEVVYEGGREEIGKVVSKSTTDAMKNLMYNVVYSGLTDAKYFKANNITMIGKTGTAQIADPNTGGYLKGSYDYVKSFAGMFPYEDPQYIVYISVKRFIGNFSEVAKNVAKVAEEIAKYKNIIETETEETNVITLDNYLNKNLTVTKESLTNMGLQVISLGSGEVITKTYPEAGSKVTSNTKIFLKTNSNDYVMPDIRGWTSNEVITLATILGIDYRINGYGNVTEQSIEVGTSITSDLILEVNLSP